MEDRREDLSFEEQRVRWLAGQQQRSQRTLLAVTVVCAFICASLPLAVGSGLGLYFFVKEAYPKVGFWKSFSPVVLFSDTLNRPCDVPLKPWLFGLIAAGCYSLNAVCLTPCSLHHFMATRLCRWDPWDTTQVIMVQQVTREGTREVQLRQVERPRRVLLLDATVLAIDIGWLLFGAWCLAGATECPQTAPELYYSSKLTVTGYLTLLISWLFSLIPPLTLRLVLWLGLVRVPGAAPVGCLEAQAVVAFDPSHFDGVAAPRECAICLENFGPEEEIRRTGGGHHFHGSCLGRWLQRAAACPVCRADLRFAAQASQNAAGATVIGLSQTRSEHVE